ncbi:CBO0543 family protein [Alicyclobacillus sp. ALC3]|uniref:CBO0543 family protein n=1 Tax=Alicyclobacillus sp. ALC3 TaxID=2796143 RepID=UPI002378F81A|nr:CBO0543 family protein [Alicyclobacillus sp. ALC3]WDL96807.1 hypothetical protein JC200_21355 [Alicyclobacillus sp. ALC3]
MFHVVASLAWLLAAWKWGDRRNWRQYYSTIQFIIIGDLLYNLFADEHPMWRYAPTPILPSHTTTNLLVIFVIYPAVGLLFLSHFPGKSILKQASYFLAWAGLWSSVEWITWLLHLITYHNRWSFWYSILFNVMTFFTLRLHYRNPPWAWLMSGIVIGLLLFHFRVPIGTSK